MTWEDQVCRHYETFWQTRAEVCPFIAGPIYELPSAFRVVRLAPHGKRDLWTYATCGMSQPDDPKAIELHMFAPYEATEITELLVVTAHFHRTATWLDLGHTVNFGRPWLPKSRCDYGLISLPYLDGPDLEKCQIEHVALYCLWSLPITQRELDFKKRNGLNELEELFDAEGIDYANPDRPSIV